MEFKFVTNYRETTTTVAVQYSFLGQRIPQLEALRERERKRGRKKCHCDNL